MKTIYVKITLPWTVINKSFQGDKADDLSVKFCKKVADAAYLFADYTKGFSINVQISEDYEQTKQPQPHPVA